MPRVSNGRPLAPQDPVRPVKRKAPRNHNLTALAVAEKQNPTRTKVRQHRLGQVEDDGSRRKIRDDEVDEIGGRVSKRQKIETSQDDDLGGDASSGSDGNKWHVGVESGDEDSDLDSDEAMGESDEERFEGFTFRGSATQTSQKTKRQTSLKNTSSNIELDLGEGEETDNNSDFNSEDEGDDLGEDAVDLATALDLNEEEEEEERQRQKRTRKSMSRGLSTQGRQDEADLPPLSGSESDNEGDEEDQLDSEEDDDVASMLSVSDDNDESANTTRLRSFVGGLNDQSSTSAFSRERLHSNVPVKPSVFGIKSSRKLTIADLLPTVTDPNLRQSLKMLHHSEKAGPQTYKGGVPGKLAPPLAKRQQDRLDRAAAYDKSKETLNRWIDTVKQNRRAEHISFPLPDPDALSAPGTKELMPTTQSQPLTSLESTIQNIMQESGLGSAKGQSADDQVQAFEELQERTMPIEEVQARRAELRKSRDLMFREEVRARRIKKIKSKGYRRVHRKEREKIAQEEHAALTAAGALNSDDEREQTDRQRAEARMGARHRDSKWAKGVKAAGRAAWDDDARAGVTDLARRDEELRKRIDGKRVANSDGSESQDTSDSEDDMSSFGSEGGSHRKLEGKLDRLESEVERAQPTSKLASMAFMRRAEASRKANNDAEIETLRKELGGVGGDTPEAIPPTSVGRMVFGVQRKTKEDTEVSKEARNEFEEHLSEDESTGRQRRGDSEEIEVHVEKTSQRSQVPNKNKHTPVTSKTGRLEEEGNPWMTKTLKNDEVYIKKTAHSMPFEKPNSRKGGSPASQVGQVQLSVAEDDTSSSESEGEDPLPQTPEGRTLSRNEELVRMTFAGDEVFEDFNREKREAVEEEGDQIIDNSLPGWGSWTGSGVSKREQRRSKGRSLTTIKGVQEDKRKDAKLDRVIVNEKVVKKVRVLVHMAGFEQC